MSRSALELDAFITRESIEHAYGQMLKRRDARDQSVPEAGLRAARARDDRLLVVLEKGAEFITKMSEEQFGRFQRDPSTEDRYKAQVSEAALWQKAYEFADKGEPLFELQWVYGAAAIHCGYI